MVGHPKKPAGRSIQQTTVVKNDSKELEKQLGTFRAEILAELAKILGEVQAAQLLGYRLPGDSNQIEGLDDTPIYIPETIGTGENIEAEINVQSKESDGGGLDDAAKALREMKRKNKEDKNER
jgi:hypothetical protein